MAEPVEQVPVETETAEPATTNGESLRLVGAPSVANPLHAMPPMLGFVGVLATLTGAWAGIVFFVGPLFGFRPDATAAWTWDMSHALTALVPGAAAFLAGILVLGASPSTVAGLGRGRLGLLGFVIAVAGAWLSFAPIAWPVLQGTGRYFAGGTPFRELVYWAGCSIGPGLILLALGSFIVGWAHRHGAMTRALYSATSEPLAA